MIAKDKLFQFRISEEEHEKLKQHKIWLLENHSINASLSSIIRGYLFAMIKNKESSFITEEQKEQNRLEIMQSLHDARQDMGGDADDILNLDEDLS